MPPSVSHLRRCALVMCSRRRMRVMVLSDVLPEPMCMLTLCWIQRVFGDDLDCGFLERLRWIESEMTDDFVTTTGTGRTTLRNTSRYTLKLSVFFGIFHRNHACPFSYGYDIKLEKCYIQPHPYYYTTLTIKAPRSTQ